MKAKKALLLLLCLTLVASCFTGCGKDETKNLAGSEVKLNGKDIYPVSCEDTITYWMDLNSQIAADYENFAETPLGQELKKRTGVNVQYIHSQSGQGTEQVNLLIASGDLPGVVEFNWPNYPGGPDSAINDGVILGLNDYIEDFAPDFYKYVNENPEIGKAVKTDIGNYFGFPFIRSEDWIRTWKGLIVRADWLEKSGLEVPKTIAEYETMLEKFKEYSTGEPLYLAPSEKSTIMHAYGIGADFYLDDKGEVQYGYARPEYKKVLETLNRWYNKGLLDRDFAVIDSKTATSNILNGRTGAYFGAVVSGIGLRLDAKPSDVPEFDLMAIGQISENGAETPEYSYMDSAVQLQYTAAVTENCENIELAMRFLNYGYTEEGKLLYNVGIEGESYEMVDGKPVLTDYLTNNPDGISISKVAPRYLRASYFGPFVQTEDYVSQSFAHPKQQQNAYDVWSKTNTKKHVMPPVTLLEEELDESSDITANLKTYVDEMAIKFITGREPLENYDKYVAQLEDFGLSKLLEMKRSALKRYNAR